MEGTLTSTGRLSIRKIPAQKAPLSWRLKNTLRWEYIWGWLANNAARAFTRITGIPCMISELRAVKFCANGEVINYGVLGRRVVTTAFVNLMVDQLITETSVWGDFKYHDSGVGITGADVGDTDIETTDGESRATGTQVESAANIYESVGTISYTTTKAITEHGLFNTAATVTLLDRHVFSAVNVVNGDSIAFTFDFTCTAGG